MRLMAVCAEMSVHRVRNERFKKKGQVETVYKILNETTPQLRESNEKEIRLTSLPCVKFLGKLRKKIYRSVGLSVG